MKLFLFVNVALHALHCHTWWQVASTLAAMLEIGSTLTCGLAFENGLGESLRPNLTPPLLIGPTIPQPLPAALGCCCHIGADGCGHLEKLCICGRPPCTFAKRGRTLSWKGKIRQRSDAQHLFRIGIRPAEELRISNPLPWINLAAEKELNTPKHFHKLIKIRLYAPKWDCLVSIWRNWK